MDDETRYVFIAPSEAEKARMLVREAVFDSMPFFTGLIWKISDPAVEQGPGIKKLNEELGIPPGIGSREITEEEACKFFRLRGCELPEVDPESDIWYEGTFSGKEFLPHRQYDGGPFESIRLGEMSRDEAKAIWD